MKIKLDFVTNSSSTTYIVCIPDNFSISLQDVERSDNFEDLVEEEDLKPFEVISGLNENLKEMKNHGIMWQDDALPGTRCSALYIMTDIMEQNKFVIRRLDSGSDDGKIICFTKNEIEQIMKIKSGEMLKDIEVRYEDKN